MSGTRHGALSLRKGVVPSAQRSARKRVGSDASGGKADGVVAAWKLFGAARTQRRKAPWASMRSSVVRCSLDVALVARCGPRGRAHDEMGRPWSRSLASQQEEDTCCEWQRLHGGGADPEKSRALEPRSEVRPNRSSTRVLGTGHGTWAFSTGDQLCPARAAGRNGAKSPTRAR
jgi:hypothetical protein